MLKKEVKAALAIIGAMVPFVAQADQPMAGQPSQSSYVAGEKIKEGQLPGAYNQSANYVIDNGYDVYLTGDYIYWHLSREGDASNNNNQEYKSGFQVGLGFDMKGMDDWNMYGKYTWYQNKGEHDSEKFSYNDAFLTLARPFYFGKKLTSSFACGLRGLWISDEHHSYQKSWALGPRFGFESNWLLGGGFKILGNIAQSVLYTRYTEMSGGLAIHSNDGYNALRAMTESYLGLGWGSYFGDQDDFHFDLTVGYDFNIYWNQHLGSYDSVGNDYLHGLNVGIRLDF